MTAIPYSDGSEQLWEELRRIDLLVRAQTIRWRLTIGASKPEHMWGMVCVTDAEIDAFLSHPFEPLDRLPADIVNAVAGFWEAAETERSRIDARLAATPEEVRLPLRTLTDVFSIPHAGRDLLLACLLPELDVRYRRLYGYLQDDVSQTSPTVELLLQILHPVATGAAGRALLDGDLARTHRLLVVPDERQDPRTLGSRPVRLDERVVGYLTGAEGTDSNLAGIVSLAEPLDWSEVVGETEDVARLERLATWLKGRQRPSPVLFLAGPNGSGRLARARALCTAADLPLLVARAPDALAADDVEQTIDLCVREAKLLGAAVYWAGCETLLDTAQPPSRWRHLVAAVESFPETSFLASTRPWEPAGRFRQRSFIRLELERPAYRLRRQLWERLLPSIDGSAGGEAARGELVAALANSFQLTQGQVLDAIAAARASALHRDPLDPRVTANDVLDSCRRQTARLVSAYARRIEPTTTLTFDDLVLPTANRRQLEELRDRIRHRSRLYGEFGFNRRPSVGDGLVAMFTGASGTGKTMAAELLAADQGVDLYKVDLSAVVSKYVGETEKHLSQVFDEVEHANAILFFDEADALFGKRGEVREARDRWANIEVNHLLQRLEEFTGPVILASNLSQNIDDAFRRRIHVVVDFPFPDAAARLRIWQRVFPPGVARPNDDDLAQIAERFAVAGGSIRNIALDAATRAVADANGHRTTINTRHIVLAVAREYQKLGKPIAHSEFGEKWHQWAQEEPPVEQEDGEGVLTVASDIQ